MAGDPIVANAGRIVQVVVEGLYQLLHPPKTRNFQDLPKAVLSAPDWALWRRAQMASLVPSSRPPLTPEEQARMYFLIGDVAKATTADLNDGTIKLYGVPVGNLERVELLPSVVLEKSGTRFDWPLNRIMGPGQVVLFHGVVFSGKPRAVESLRDQLSRNVGGRPADRDAVEAGKEARRRWQAGRHGGEGAYGALRKCSDEVANECQLDAEAVYRRAKSVTADD